jgi:transcriptional regulator with XRE-family HTH domain
MSDSVPIGGGQPNGLHQKLVVSEANGCKRVGRGPTTGCMTSARNFPATCSKQKPPPDEPSSQVIPAPPGPSVRVISARAVFGMVTCTRHGDDEAGATDVTLAPQPAQAQACRWSIERQMALPGMFAAVLADVRSTHELGVREDDIDSAVRWTQSRADRLILHGRAYAPHRSSLSVCFAVHENGRDLDTGRSFGRHVRSLRRARGMTQEVLAERCGLSADTIRRLEHGSFSPSLDTLRKLCGGLDLMLSTLFESYELGARNEARELIDLLATRGPRELVLATRVLRALFNELDGITAVTTPEPVAAPPSDDDAGDSDED